MRRARKVNSCPPEIIFHGFSMGKVTKVFPRRGRRHAFCRFGSQVYREARAADFVPRLPKKLDVGLFGLRREHVPLWYMIWSAGRRLPCTTRYTGGQSEAAIFRRTRCMRRFHLSRACCWPGWLYWCSSCPPSEKNIRPEWCLRWPEGHATS